MDDQTGLLEWLAKGLKQPGRTQRGLSKALGLDPASVTRMLKGVRRMRFDEIEPAAAYLKIGPPAGFRRKLRAVDPDGIEVPAELRAAVRAKAMDLGIEAEEFVARAVRAALAIFGPEGGKRRY